MTFFVVTAKTHGAPEAETRYTCDSGTVPLFYTSFTSAVLATNAIQVTQRFHPASVSSKRLRLSQAEASRRPLALTAARGTS